MTNVLVVTERFYPPWSDGTVSYARGLVDSISEAVTLGKNLEITVLSLTDKMWFPKRHHHEMKEYFQKTNLKLEWFSTSERWQQMNLWKLFRKISQNKNYELVHLIYLGLNPLLMSIPNKNRSIIAKHLMVYPFHQSFSVEKYLYNFFYKTRIFQGRNINLVFSSEVLQRLYNAKEASVLPPAVDTSFYRPRSRSPEVYGLLMNASKKLGDASEILQKDAVALYMGPLSHERFDYRCIISGFAKLCRENGVDGGLLIVGRGFEQPSFLEEIKKYVDVNGLTHRVFICMKSLTETEKSLLFNGSDVFIYPITAKLHHMSIVFPPISLLEAMASGLCVISGGLPGQDSFIKNSENGILLEDKITSKTIADAALVSIQKKKTISQNARLTVEKNFSVKQVSKLYSEFLSKVGV